MSFIMYAPKASYLFHWDPGSRHRINRVHGLLALSLTLLQAFQSGISCQAATHLLTQIYLCAMNHIRSTFFFYRFPLLPYQVEFAFAS